jgi:hypothetical protein
MQHRSEIKLKKMKKKKKRSSEPLSKEKAWDSPGLCQEHGVWFSVVHQQTLLEEASCWECCYSKGGLDHLPPLLSTAHQDSAFCQEISKGFCQHLSLNARPTDLMSVPTMVWMWFKCERPHPNFFVLKALSPEW